MIRLLRPRIADNLSVDNFDNPFRLFGDIRRVRDQNHGMPAL